MSMKNKKLYRSRENKVFLGIMGGLGEYFDIDPVLLRAGYIFVSVFGMFWPGVIAYLFMALIIPRYPKPETKTSETKTEVKHEEKKEEVK